MFRHIIAIAASLSAIGGVGRLPAQSTSAASCTYEACALSIIPRLTGLDVVRGEREERVGTLGFLVPRSVGAAFAGDAAAGAHARRALSMRRVGALMTDLGGIVATAGAVRAAACPGRCRAPIRIALGGLTLMGSSVWPQFAADAELSRAVREYNKRFAR